MKQFRKILCFELQNYLKNKIFVGVTLFLVLLIAVLMFFPRLTQKADEENGATGKIPAFPTERREKSKIFPRFFSDFRKVCPVRRRRSPPPFSRRCPGTV